MGRLLWVPKDSTSSVQRETAALRDFNPAYIADGSTTAVISTSALGLLDLSQPKLAVPIGTAGSRRYCCKSPKLPGANFPAARQSNPRPSIDIALITLPRSSVNLSSGDEVPRIFTRKSRLQLGELSIACAKRLLQQQLRTHALQQTIPHSIISSARSNVAVGTSKPSPWARIIDGCRLLARDGESHRDAWPNALDDLDFGETPCLDKRQPIESGPLWRGRRYFSANLAMSDHLSRAGALGSADIGARCSSTRLV
jgi:hypothetical protein